MDFIASRFFVHLIAKKSKKGIFSFFFFPKFLQLSLQLQKIEVCIKNLMLSIGSLS